MGSSALEVIDGRRSTREFAGDPVGEADIRDLPEAAMNAPSAVNEQAWQFVVLSGAVRKLLGIPENVVPFSCIPVGRPAAGLPKAQSRFDDRKVHRQGWGGRGGEQ